MILRSLKMNDVKCFEDSEVSFASGKNVIIGRNGSGKSTILQSILYSLYGYYPPGNNDEMVRIGKDYAEFELEFEHRGQEYIVQRKLRLSGSPEAFLLTSRNSPPIAEKQSVVTNEISEKLDISREIFSDVILVGQGEIAEIIGMPKGNRKELFDKLLGLHDYEVAWGRCRRIERLLKNEIETSADVIKAYEEPASKLDERKEELETKQEQKRETEAELGKTKKALTKKQSALDQLNDLERQIRNLETKVSQRGETIQQVEADRSELFKKILNFSKEAGFDIPEVIEQPNANDLADAAKDKHTAIKEKLESKRTEKEEYSQKAESLKYLEDKLRGQEAELEKKEGDVEKKREEILSIEPSLNEIITGKWAQKLTDKRAELDTQKQRIETRLSDISDLESKRKNETEKGEEIQSSISRLEERLEKNAQEAASKVAENWKELANIDLRGLSPRLRSIEKQEEEYKSKLKDLGNKKGRNENQIEQYKEDLKDLSDIEGKKCPKCKQIVDDEHAESLRREIKGKLQKAKDELDALNEEEAEVETELNDIENEMEELNQRKESIIQARIYLDNETDVLDDLKREEQRLEKTKDEVQAITEELNEFDPQALENEKEKQESTISDLDRISTPSKELPQLQLDIEELQSELEDLTEEISDLRAEKPDDMVNALEQEISELQTQEEIFGELYHNLSRLVDTLEKLANLNEKQDQDEDNLSNLNDSYDAKKHEELTQEVKILGEERARLDQTIDTLENELIPNAKELYEDSEKAAKKIEQVTAKEERATKALAVVSKVREFYREVQKPLRKRDTARASNHATEIFKTLIGSNEYDRIRIGENHDLQISRFGIFEPMSRLSGGEQVLAGLAVRLGFARALATSDLLMLDEPTAYLDDHRKTELVETLSRVSPANQIIIVTHDDEFHRVADRVVNVEKDEALLTSSINW